MLKVALCYMDGFDDHKNIMKSLLNNKARIIKHSKFSEIKKRIIFMVDNTEQLYKILGDINRSCIYSVAIVRIKATTACKECRYRFRCYWAGRFPKIFKRSYKCPN